MNKNIKKTVALGMAAAMVAVPAVMADHNSDAGSSVQESFCNVEEQLFDNLDNIYDEVEHKFVELDNEWDALEREYNAAQTEEEQNQIDAKFEALDAKYDALEQNSGLIEAEAQIDNLYNSHLTDEQQDIQNQIDELYEEHAEAYADLEDELYELYDEYDEAWENDAPDKVLDKIDEEIYDLEDQLFDLDDKFGITALYDKLPDIYCEDDFEEDRIYEVEEEIDSLFEQHRDIYEPLDRELDERLDALVDADPEDQPAIIADIESINQKFEAADQETGLDALFYELGRLWYSFVG
jgi:chromosome segregation ATPase